MKKLIAILVMVLATAGLTSFGTSTASSAPPAAVKAAKKFCTAGTPGVCSHVRVLGNSPAPAFAFSARCWRLKPSGWKATWEQFSATQDSIHRGCNYVDQFQVAPGWLALGSYWDSDPNPLWYWGAGNYNWNSASSFEVKVISVGG